MVAEMDGKDRRREKEKYDTFICNNLLHLISSTVICSIIFIVWLASWVTFSVEVCNCYKFKQRKRELICLIQFIVVVSCPASIAAITDLITKAALKFNCSGIGVAFTVIIAIQMAVLHLYFASRGSSGNIGA